MATAKGRRVCGHRRQHRQGGRVLVMEGREPEPPQKSPSPGNKADKGDRLQNLQMKLRLTPSGGGEAWFTKPVWWVSASMWLGFVVWLRADGSIRLELKHLEMIALYGSMVLAALVPVTWGMWQDRLSPDRLNFRRPTAASLLLMTVLTVALFSKVAGAVVGIEAEKAEARDRRAQRHERYGRAPPPGGVGQGPSAATEVTSTPSGRM